MRWVLALVVISFVASGCADKPSPPEGGVEGTPAGQPFSPANNASALPMLVFATPEYEQTTTYDGAFSTPDTCFQQDCEQIVEFDITAQVPASAPVELAATLEASSCVRSWLVVADGDSVREVEGGTELATHVVRTAAGVVTLAVSQCSISGGDPTASTVPFTAEVRTAVRPGVLPARMPVAVELAAGDRLQGMGQGLDELAVYAPGQPPLRLEKPFEFTADAAGTHVVIAVGTGETMLHGPGVPLAAIPLRAKTGEGRALQSGQDLSWDVDVPGILLQLTMEIATDGGGPGVTYMGGYTMRAAQGGKAFFAVEQDDCIVPCSVGASGSSWSRYGSGFLPEGIGIGPVTFTVTNTQSMGYQVTESIVWIEPGV